MPEASQRLTAGLTAFSRAHQGAPAFAASPVPDRSKTVELPATWNFAQWATDDLEMQEAA
jgi:hypothetical protein